jgi:hypothetical protein
MARDHVKSRICDEFAEKLVQETIRVMTEKVKRTGQDIARDLFATYLTKLVGTITYGTLTSAPHGMNAEDKYKYTAKAYALLKLDLQNSLSDGVQDAVKAFTGRDQEYYCQILPIPESVNKEPC